MQEKNKLKTLLYGLAAAAVAAAVFVPVAFTMNTPTPQAKSTVTPAKYAMQQSAASSPMQRLAAPMSSTAPEIYGVAGYRDGFWLCSFNAEPNMSVNKIFCSDDLFASAGIVYADGLLYVASYTLNSYGSIDSNTQYIFDPAAKKLVETREGLPPESVCITMAYDESTDRVYCYYNEPEYEPFGYYGYGIMNMNTGWITLRGDIEMYDVIVAMAFTQDGEMYGVNSHGQFQKIDKNTGATTTIGHTDVIPGEGAQSACVDPVTGKFYWSAWTDMEKGALYEIDYATGHATLVANYPANENMAGIYIKEPVAPAEAPAAVDDIAVEFEGPSLTGNVTFTAPSKTKGGSAISGKMTACVLLDGITKEIEVTPGQQCSVEMTVPGPEYYNVRVWIKQGDLRSDKNKIKKWLGPDYPTVPTNVQLRQEDNKIVLTWDAPQKGVHGGYVNPDDFTYIISRIGLWRDGIAETRFEEDVPTGKMVTYTYSIRPSYMGLNGEIAYSESMTFGDSYFGVPATLGFKSIFDMSTIIDANNDGNTFTPTVYGTVDYESKSGSGAADDWFITPSFRLKGNTHYRLTLYAQCQYIFCKEIVDIRYGKGTTPEAMTGEIGRAEVLNLGDDTPESYTLYFKTDEAGDFNLGYHCVSTNGSVLKLSTMVIEEFANWNNPEPATELTAVTPADGSLKADISFKAPEKTLSGATLTALNRIEVSRNGVTIKTFENPAPGGRLKFTDEAAVQGKNTYSVVCYNTGGEASEAVTATVNVGIDIPSLPTNVKIKREGDKAVVTWTAPTSGVEGRFFDPENVAYRIYNGNTGEIYADNVKECTFAITLDQNAEQYTVVPGIMPFNSAGYNEDIAYGDMIIAGKPHQLPFVENYTNGWSDNQWYVNGGGQWSVKGTENPEGGKGATSFYASGSSSKEVSGSLKSGKIDLRGNENPVLSFWTGGWAIAKNCRLVISIADEYDGNYIPLKTINFDAVGSIYDEVEWMKVELPLSRHNKKEYVHLRFTFYATCDDFNGWLSNIVVRDVKESDLAVTSVTSDCEFLEAGKDIATITAQVSNLGKNEVSAADYKVEFYAGDRLFATADGKALEVGAKTTVSAEYTALSADGRFPKISACTVYSADEDTSNDSAELASIEVKLPEMPEVGALTGKIVDGKIRLSWIAPAADIIPAGEVTEGFENYTVNKPDRAGDWSFIDGDKGYVWTDYYLPCAGEQMAYVVINPTKVRGRWSAHSGEQCIAAFYNYGATDNDDWLISPELSGNAQTISFYALSGESKTGHETFELWYSTDGTAREDFVCLTSEAQKADFVWTEHEYQLPAGAKHFAVRCTSHNRTALLLDDFRYERAARPLEVTFVGFNIYRDGELLNSTPIADTSFTDTTAEKGNYTVKVVYNTGESYGRSIFLDVNGIDSVEVDSNSDDAYYDLNGMCVRNPEPGKIYIHKGKKIILSR